MNMHGTYTNNFRAVATARAFVWQRLPIRLLAAAGLALLVLTYIGLTNSVATQGYRLSELQNEVTTTSRTNNELELDITAARSLPRVEAAAGTLSMQPVQQIEYLATSGTSVAVR